MRRLSWIFWLGPKCNHVSLWDTELYVIHTEKLIWRRIRERFEYTVLEEWSNVVQIKRKLENLEEVRLDSPLDTLERTGLWWHLGSTPMIMTCGCLAFSTMNEWISVIWRHQICDHLLQQLQETNIYRMVRE